MNRLLPVFILSFLISSGNKLYGQKEVTLPDWLLPNIGIKAGLNLSNFLEEDNESAISTDYTMNKGFHAGLTFEIHMGKLFSFEPGLLFSMKGYNYYDEWHNDSLNQDEAHYEEMRLYYLDIPLNMKASLDIGKFIIYGTAGPYLGIGLSGKEYYYDEIDGVTTDDEEEKISWGNNENKDRLRGLDYGLTLGAGIEVWYLQLGFAYDLGLANISVYRENDYKINNRVLRISLTYKFGKIE